jgi:hypothetical protein
MTPAQRAPVGALALALALTLTGCGDDQPAADPSPSTSSPAATPEESASPTESSDPSQPSEPTDTGGPAAGDTYADVSPTTGQELVSGAGSIRAPADWPRAELDSTSNVIGGPSVEYAIELSDGGAIGNETADSLVDSNLKVGSYGDDVQRLDDVVIAGQPAYHLAGPDEIFPSFVDEFSMVIDGREYTMRVSTPQELPQAERDALVSSVVASFEVTG